METVNQTTLLKVNKISSPKILDSGIRQSFTTGSQRDTRDGKGRFDLLPTRAIARLAKHFENGSKKYGDRNWEKGQPISRYMDSGLRHAFKFLQGETDEDHLIAACWNLICAVDTQERIKAGLLSETLNDLNNDNNATAQQQDR
jgi:hypothetical protein